MTTDHILRFSLEPSYIPSGVKSTSHRMLLDSTRVLSGDDLHGAGLHHCIQKSWNDGTTDQRSDSKTRLVDLSFKHITLNLTLDDAMILLLFPQEVVLVFDTFHQNELHETSSNDFPTDQRTCFLLLELWTFTHEIKAALIRDDTARHQPFHITDHSLPSVNETSDRDIRHTEENSLRGCSTMKVFSAHQTWKTDDFSSKPWRFSSKAVMGHCLSDLKEGSQI